MDSEAHVMLMQQGEGKKPAYAIARYDTLERRIFPFRAWSAIKHLMIQEVKLTMGRVISPHPDNVEIGYFCYSKKKKEKKR